ncbi:hypothetical protein FJY71_09390, partial [candidate division WOR-3 bacterium]|nr:hypothetical protein [candidate division WOR-3 bacterium]
MSPSPVGFSCRQAGGPFTAVLTVPWRRSKLTAEKETIVLRTCRVLDGKIAACTEPECTIMVFVAPNEAEKRRLVEEYRIDEHTLSSALDPDELARLEFEPEHVAVIYKRPRNYSGADGVLFKVTSTGLFLFRDRLIIVQPEDLQLFDGRHFTRAGSLGDVILRL